jgi:hypothetical protein
MRSLTAGILFRPKLGRKTDKVTPGEQYVRIVQRRSPFRRGDHIVALRSRFNQLTTSSIRISPDLMSPHLLRSLRTVKVVSVHTSSHSSHVVAIDINGIAHLWGRASNAALGLPMVAAVWEESPLKISPQDLGATRGTKFVHAATGRSHTLLVGSDGSIWSAGGNSSGQVSSNSYKALGRLVAELFVRSQFSVGITRVPKSLLSSVSPETGQKVVIRSFKLLPELTLASF